MDSMFTDSRISAPRNIFEMDTNFLNLPSGPQHDHNTSPSLHFGLASNSQGDLGSLRPDKVTSFSYIGCVTPEGNSARSSFGSGKMIIKRTKGWEVQETYEYAPSAEYGEGISKIDDVIRPVEAWGARHGDSAV